MCTCTFEQYMVSFDVIFASHAVLGVCQACKAALFDRKLDRIRSGGIFRVTVLLRISLGKILSCLKRTAILS